MKKSVLIITFILVSIFLFPQSYAEGLDILTQEERDYLNALGPITMVIDPDWAPFERLTEEGEFAGIAADLLALIEERLEIEFVLIPTQDWSETLAYSKEGRALIIPFLNQTPAREEWLTFTDPLFIDPNVIITHVDFPPIDNLSHLSNKTIILPEGTSIEERIRKDYPNLKILTTDRENDIFIMIENGEADLTIRSRAIAAYTIRKEGLFNLKINAQIPKYTNYLRMGVLLEEPQLRSILNKGIATITSVERDAIFNKHVNITIEEQIEYKWFVFYITGFVVIIFVLVYWNYRQKRIQLKIESAKNALQVNQERFYQLAEQSKTYVWEINLDGRFTYLSPSVESVLGYMASDRVHSSYIYEDVVPEQKNAVSKVLFENMQQGKKLNNYEMKLLHKNGTEIDLLVNGIPIFDANQVIIGYRGTSTDITQRKMIENILAENEHQYRLLFENAVEAIVVLQQGYIKICNPMAEDITGYSEIELKKMPITALVYEEDRDFAEKLHIERTKGYRDKTKEIFRLVRQDQQVIWIETKGIMIEWEGKPASLNFITDITERKSIEENIVYLSYYDQLTGIYNRRFFEEELKRLDHQRSLPLSLVMIDVNGLKLFNDGFGHEAGDALITTVAQTIKNASRSTDIAARIGGDEFVLLLPNTSQEEAQLFSQRLSKAIALEQVKGLPISVSMGYESKYDVTTNVRDILTRAEEYMYHKKVTESMAYREKLINIILEKLFLTVPWERIHAERVGLMARDFAEFLNFKATETENIEQAAYYHDIGKIGVDLALLVSKTPLNPHQKKEVQRHVEIGYQLLKSTNKYMKIAPIVLSHHENWDGSGYPEKLSKEQIPIESRILCVIDAYEKLLQGRPDQKPLTHEQAINVLKSSSGTIFDPALIEAFVQFIHLGL